MPICVSRFVQLAALVVAAVLPGRQLASGAASVHPADIHLLLASAQDAHQWIVGLRRELHAIPELGSQEFKTSAVVKRTLTELGIPFTSVFGTGVVATLGDPQAPPERSVALRADMDALPIQEPEGLPFASTHEGAMHACGHDGHTSMLLGAARLLKALEASAPNALAGGQPWQVRLVFQPNEEFGAGGDHVVREGALDGVSSVFGVHVAPWIPSGHLGVRAGTIMAGALSFHVVVTGRGGHAAMPHLNVDPVVAVAGIISSLQTLISRETSPLGSAVLSVTLLRAGHAYNVIPDTAEFGGTIRALTHEVIETLQHRLEALVASLAAGYGCNATVDWRLDEQPYYPPTVNDPAAMQFAKDAAAKVLGTAKVLEVEPILAGEDFSFLCRKVPCHFGFLGIRNETLGSVHALHNPRFMLDEQVLFKGAALHAAWATQWLERAAGGSTAGQHEEL